VNHKEDHAQILLGQSEPSKEPVGHKRIRQETTTKRIQRKERSQLPDNLLAFGRNLYTVLQRILSADFDGGREQQVQSRHPQIQG